MKNLLWSWARMSVFRTIFYFFISPIIFYHWKICLELEFRVQILVIEPLWTFYVCLFPTFFFLLKSLILESSKEINLLSLFYFPKITFYRKTCFELEFLDENRVSIPLVTGLLFFSNFYIIFIGNLLSTRVTCSNVC